MVRSFEPPKVPANELVAVVTHLVFPAVSYLATKKSEIPEDEKSKKSSKERSLN